MSAKAGAGTQLDFALLGHPDSYNHLSALIKHSRPDYDTGKLTRYKNTLSKIFEWAPSYAAPTPLTLTRSDGTLLNGRLIICTFLPEAIDSPRQMMSAYKKTRSGCQVAKDLGAKVVGLGGFTSIVGGTQGEKLADDYGLAVTSGNSLTAALALAQLNALLTRLGWALHGRTVAVLGASGDIGRACALMLALRASRTLLIARNRAKLEALHHSLPPNLDVYVSTDPQDAAEADIIVTATSASEPLLAEADLKAGTIVCDIGYPKTMTLATKPRADVLVFSAGLAAMPVDLNIQYYTRLPTARITYGCFAEAMVLSLARRYESYSIGQGRITPERMDHILRLARDYDFRPAPLYRGERLLTDEMIEAFLKVVSGARPRGARTI